MKFSQIAIMSKIAVPEDTIDKIRKYTDKLLLYPKKEEINDCDCILVTWKDKVDAEFLSYCPKLKFICLCSTNSDNIDKDAANKRGIRISNVTDYGDIGVAEWIIAELLILARGMGKYKWKHDELSGRTIGIIGLGTIGKLLAEIGLAMHMKVLHHSRSRKPEWEKKGVKSVDKKTLLEESDIICLQTPKNVKILDASDFGLMKEKILVNNTLGKAFDEKDFLRWMKEPDNYAIMDRAVEFDFRSIDRVIVRDFVSGLTKEAGERLAEKVEENLEGFLGDGKGSRSYFI